MDARSDFDFIFGQIFGKDFNEDHEKRLDDLWDKHDVDSYYKEFFKLQSLGYIITKSDGKHTVVKT